MSEFKVYILRTIDDETPKYVGIVMVCNGKRLSTGGYKFRYHDSDYKGIIKKSGNPGRKVSFEYNNIKYEFDSVTNAAKSLGLSRKKIYKLL